MKLCSERVNVNENKHPVLGDQSSKGGLHNTMVTCGGFTQ